MSPLHTLLGRLASSIRLGHATNSSSSHSILLVAPERVAVLRQVREEGTTVERGEPDEHGYVHSTTVGWERPATGDYGWEWFAATERVEKLDYLWTMMVVQIRELLRFEDGGPSVYAFSREIELPDLGEGINAFAGALASYILEHAPEEVTASEASVDHDSCFSFPLDSGTRAPHVGFARWFRDRVLAENAVVLGGNDNDHQRPQPDRRSGVDLRAPLMDDEHQRPALCFDREDHWLLYRKSDGWKVRVSKVEGADIPHSNVPELVDLKITDACAMGCAFCYQGSTPDGKHASMRSFEVQEFIKGLDVREVAIGGGEPLEHPEFWDIIAALQSPTRTVNVTTRRPDKIPAWKLHLFGGIGFSTESPTLAERVFERLGLLDEPRDHDNPWRQKLVLHVVLGATSRDQLVDLLHVAKKAGVEVLLLGYKTDGRGSAFTPFPVEGWIDCLREEFRKSGYWSGPKLGVDTSIVERWGPEIQTALRVDPKFMSPGEGKFSLYVDLVDRSYAPASYGCARTSLEWEDTGTFVYRAPEEAARRAVAGFRSWHTA